jgi:glycosyltransferase involved in cell wall biosynthesis
VKKIFFLINSLSTGGSEKVVAELAQQLSHKAHVKVFTVIGSAREANGVEVKAISNLSSISRAFLFQKRLIKEFASITSSEKPDIVVSFLELSNLVNIHAKETGSHKYKCVISVRANPSYVYEKGIYGMVFRNLIKNNYHKANLVITNSKLSKKDLEKNFNVSEKKTFVSYNPLNLAEAQKKAKEKLPPMFSHIWNRKNKVIISVGRLTYLKAHDLLLQSFAKLRAKEKNAHLVLVGDGELEHDLKVLAAKLDVAANVHFIGAQANPYRFVARSDIFVFTSLYEGFPNAVLEALAVGTPVVSVDCRSGPREILSPKTNPFDVAKGVELGEYGVLVPPFGGVNNKFEVERREELLKEAIINVLNTPKLKKKYEAAGKRRARDFDAKKTAEEFYKIIN